MRLSDFVSIAVNAAFGAVTGWLLLGIPGAAGGMALGAAFGYTAARFNVRPAVAMTVFVGAMAGGLIGSSIVSTICLPDACTTLEVVAGVVTAIASFVGVGIVAALVTRSFDEYNERADAGLPPTEVGCEVGDSPQPTAHSPQPDEDDSALS
jgi:hypothetical protein